MKLTKKNQELVTQIANGFITTPILAVLTQDGHEITAELLAGVNHVVSQADTSQLQKTVGDALAERLDFKALTKVNKFLAEPDTQLVLQVVQEVNQLVSPVVNEIAAEILLAASKPQEVAEEV